jgi:hypothetical protein
MIMSKKLALAFLFLAGCGRAGNFLIEAAPEPAGKGASPKRLLVAPFKDARLYRFIYGGKNGWDEVVVDAAGKTTMAKAWSGLKKGDLSYLWQRQLAYQLDDMGFSLSRAAEPLSQPEALSLAAQVQANYVLSGEIRKMGVDKHGADFLLGTNISGTNYSFRSLTHFDVLDAATGKPALSKDFKFEQVFLKKDFLGASDRETFPAYFNAGLAAAAQSVASDPDLRTLAGLPTLVPTPTPTFTPLVKPTATPGPALKVVTPTPVPTASGPYWVNPKTGKRMDPSWKFDPEDGTPRSQFILHDPSTDKGGDKGGH